MARDLKPQLRHFLHVTSFHLSTFLWTLCIHEKEANDGFTIRKTTQIHCADMAARPIPAEYATTKLPPVLVKTLQAHAQLYSRRPGIAKQWIIEKGALILRVSNYRVLIPTGIAVL